MRPLVSYDDIASQAPSQSSPPPPHNGLTSSSGSPPKKRRKNNYRQNQGQGQRYGDNRPRYHNDDYEEEYQDPPKPKPKKPRNDYGLKEESRQLTHDEVWDDSALIRAWDAAVEEYAVLNGPDKKWKTEPVNKSALWYNIPPEKEEPSPSSPGPSFLMPSIPTAFMDAQEPEKDMETNQTPTDPDNSRPVNFNTFVPLHDPSLAGAAAQNQDTADDTSRAWRGQGMGVGVVPPAPAGFAGQVTKERAFEQAMGAWYWAGYWTGVYHSAGKGSGAADKTQKSKDDDEHEMADAAMNSVLEQELEEQDAAGEDEDLIPT